MFVVVSLVLIVFEGIISGSSLPLNIEQLQNTIQQGFQPPIHFGMDPQLESDQLTQKLAERFGNAYATTYDQERASVDNTLNLIQDLGKKSVESGVNLLKNGLEFFFIVPTFGRNMLPRQRPYYNQNYLL